VRKAQRVAGSDTAAVAAKTTARTSQPFAPHATTRVSITTGAAICAAAWPVAKTP
jgi:hypothetical protein